MSKLYHILQRLAEAIDHLVTVLGKLTAWLSVVLVILTCVVVALRYGFGVGAIALQESALYIYAALFMLGAAYTFVHDDHVRVDVFYRRFSAPARAWVNILGGLVFLLPMALSMVWLSWDFVAQAWDKTEGSMEAEGLPLVFLLKTMIPVCGGLLSLQALSSVIKNTLALTGFMPFQNEDMHEAVC